MALEPVDEKYDAEWTEDVDPIVDWGTFSQQLTKIVRDGILCVMVLSATGNLLSSYGAQSKSAKRITPPLLTSIWNITSEVGKRFVDACGMETMIVNCKMGRIAISGIPDDEDLDKMKYFVCLLAEKEMELGLLKVKLELITDQLFNENEEEDEDELEMESDPHQTDVAQDTVDSTNINNDSASAPVSTVYVK